MSKLSILEQNAYLSVVIKDNGIWANLAYTDHNANREYILTDFTDLSPLRYRLDDDVFTKEFWFEYLDNLEKVFNWDIVDRNSLSVFTFRKFKNEGDGLSGIRFTIDDNQRFFNKIFQSIRDFSRDIALRVLDDRYVQNFLEGFLVKGEYDDILYVDMDLLDFSVFRAKRLYNKKNNTHDVQFSRSKLSWKEDFPLIDSVNDARLRAFLATDLTNQEISNYWANFVQNRIFASDDPNLVDILRSYSTIQNHSIYRDNEAKLEGFGYTSKDSAIIISGYVPRILGKRKTLLSLIDGLEISGNMDCYWDLEMKLLSYGQSYINGTNSTDIILTRKDLIPYTTKIVIPEIKEKKYPNKVVFSGSIESLEDSKKDFYAMIPEFTYIDIPKHEHKLVIEGEFKKGVHTIPEKERFLGFVSTPGGKKYESLIIDARPKPIIYGPDSYANKLKLQSWLK